MAIEIVSVPIENDDLHSYVSLPEGKALLVNVPKLGDFQTFTVTLRDGEKTAA